MHSLAAGMICLALAGAGEQPNPNPRSPAAVAAIKRSEKSIAEAEAQFRKAKGDALRQLVADLEAAKAESMKAGSLDEANRVQARIDEVTEEMKNDAPASVKLARLLGGSRWAHEGGRNIVAYAADGTVSSNAWGNKSYRWTQTGPRTVRQGDPADPAVEITFDDDLKHALWVYASGKVSFAVRAK